MSTLTLFLLDESNNIKRDIYLDKPKTYQDLLKNIKEEMNNSQENYDIFILDKNNKEMKINNKDNYKLIEDIIFIRKIYKDLLEKSLFEINYDKLSESKQNIFDEKFMCIFCSIIIKKENPYLCYKCQNIFHEKCLKIGIRNAKR